MSEENQHEWPIREVEGKAKPRPAKARGSARYGPAQKYLDEYQTRAAQTTKQGIGSQAPPSRRPLEDDCGALHEMK